MKVLDDFIMFHKELIFWAQVGKADHLYLMGNGYPLFMRVWGMWILLYTFWKEGVWESNLKYISLGPIFLLKISPTKMKRK